MFPKNSKPFNPKGKVAAALVKYATGKFTPYLKFKNKDEKPVEGVNDYGRRTFAYADGTKVHTGINIDLPLMGEKSKESQLVSKFVARFLKLVCQVSNTEFEPNTKEIQSIELYKKSNEVPSSEFKEIYPSKFNEAVADIVILKCVFGDSDRDFFGTNIKYYDDGNYALFDFEMFRKQIDIDEEIAGVFLDLLMLPENLLLDIYKILYSKLESLNEFYNSKEGVQLFKEIIEDWNVYQSEDLYKILMDRIRVSLKYCEERLKDEKDKGEKVEN